MPSLRIAHIIDSLRIGGAQSLLVIFASLAASRQMEMTAISLYADQDLTITDALRSHGAQVVSFPGRRLLSPGRFVRLARFLRQEPIDVVHTHLTYANAIGVLAARLAGKPVVSTLHSTGHAAYRLHPAAEALERGTMRFLAQRVIAVGETVAQAYRPTLGKKEIIVIPNAVQEAGVLTPEERLVLRREIAGDSACPILISVGRFVPAKAYDDLLRAFARVHATYPQAVLVIVGDGPLFAEIRELAQRLGVTTRICLPGSRQDVPRWLAASDIYVSASIWEGLPLSVLEAMMAGLPVVATAVGDIPRVLAPVDGRQEAQMGRIVPPQQPEALAQAIGELLGDPALRCQLGAAAQAQARSRYSADRWMDRLESIYQALAQEKHLRPTRPAPQPQEERK